LQSYVKPDGDDKPLIQPFSGNDAQNRFLRIASATALNSNCKRYKLGTIIVNRKTDEVVSTGYNHYSKTIKNAVTCHSEIDSMQRIRKYPKQKRSELDLYVVRINDRGEMKYAKPCRDCATAIQSFGIKRVYYSYSECRGKFDSKDEPKETYTVRSPQYAMLQQKFFADGTDDR
jgi:deoxycytidylate deaminase